MKSQKGITLVALVITIIVMLILVGVSVTIALKGELFKKAKDARDRTNANVELENQMSDGKINVNGNIWNIDNIVNGEAN